MYPPQYFLDAPLLQMDAEAFQSWSPGAAGWIAVGAAALAIAGQIDAERPARQSDQDCK